jgi:hypothetical protein
MSVSARLALVFALLVAVSAGLAAATWSGRAHAAVSSNLNAGFDADGNIYLTFSDGTRIGSPNPPGTVVPAGTYTIALNNNSLDDLGNPHSFHLFGPGVNLAANGAVQATWTATFQTAASYTYQDDLNPTTIHDVFGTPGSGATSSTVPVTTTTPPNTSTTPPKNNSPLAAGGPKKVAPLRGKLVGAVTAAGAPSLKLKGKTVTSLRAGRYTFAITDHSHTRGFTVQEAKRSSKSVTGARFTGRRSRTIILAAGQWFFYSSFVGKKTYFIVRA